MNEKKIPFTDENRIKAHEAYQEIKISRYAIIALQKEIERMTLAIEMLKKQAAEEKEKIDKNESALEKYLDKIRKKYDIEDDWIIDTKTGNVYPQKPDTENGAK